MILVLIMLMWICLGYGGLDGKLLSAFAFFSGKQGVVYNLLEHTYNHKKNLCSCHLF
jgi:hypothetical protein